MYRQSCHYQKLLKALSSWTFSLRNHVFEMSTCCPVSTRSPPTSCFLLKACWLKGVPCQCVGPRGEPPHDGPHSKTLHARALAYVTSQSLEIFIQYCFHACTLDYSFFFFFFLRNITLLLSMLSLQVQYCSSILSICISFIHLLQ